MTYFPCSIFRLFTCYNIQIVALCGIIREWRIIALEMSVIESRCYFGEIDNSGLCKWQNVLCLALQTQLGFGSADFFFPRLTALFYIPGQACIAIRITSLLSVIFVTITHVIRGCYKVFIVSLGWWQSLMWQWILSIYTLPNKKQWNLTSTHAHILFVPRICLILLVFGLPKLHFIFSILDRMQLLLPDWDVANRIH